MEQFETLNDVVHGCEGALKITPSSGDLDTPISDFRHMIFCPHGVIPGDLDNTDPKMVAAQIPKHLAGFRQFLMEDPNAAAVLRYSWYRADGGAHELAEAIMRRFANNGEQAFCIEPAWIGRGVLDLNRPNESAVGEALFIVPPDVERDLRNVHAKSTRVTFALAHQLMNARTLGGIIQPHTMASGGSNQTDLEELERLINGYPALESGATYPDSKKIAAILALWEEIYSGMNSGRGRENIDVVLHKHGTQVPVGNERVSNSLLQGLQRAGLPAKFDDPFGHGPGYPGSDLAAEAKAADVPELTLDVPRHLLLKDTKEQYPLTGFSPDAGRIEKVANAVIATINSVRPK